MTNAQEPSLEAKFHNRLLAAVSEVGLRTRLGLAAIREDIQNVGGLQSAKLRLKTRIRVGCISARPSKYFLTTRRIGRMDLSVEAIALEPGWLGLFTPGEIDQAMATLSEYGFSPALEAPTEPSAGVPAPFEREPSLAPIRLSEPRRAFTLESIWARARPHGECELTAESVIALRNGGHPPAHPLVRKHIGECLKCGNLYPDLAAAFERFDEMALQTWSGMLAIFRTAMNLEDEHIKRFVLLAPDDLGQPEEYQPYFDHELEFIRPICAWRAVRLGCHIAKFMSAFTWTFMETGDLWLRWRRGELRGPVSDIVRATGREEFLLALTAENLLLPRSWPTEDEGVLWMPADEDFAPVPGVVIDPSDDLDEWEELLGKPPEDLHPYGILYLAYCAAIAQLGEPEPGSKDLVQGAGPSEQMDRMEGILRDMQRSQAEDRERQDAIIGQLERVVLNMKSTDRAACEESLLAELPGVYGKLAPGARNLCLASEQVYRTPGYAAPGDIVRGLATAFELQLRHTVMPGLFDYLEYRGVKNLKIPEEWIRSHRAQDRSQPLWRRGEKADKCELGTMDLILGHPEPFVAEFFVRHGFSLADIQEATDLVRKPRNAVSHGSCFDIGTAEAIRADWFHWKNRPGGIFSVFFRNE